MVQEYNDRRQKVLDVCKMIEQGRRSGDASDQLFANDLYVDLVKGIRRDAGKRGEKPLPGYSTRDLPFPEVKS